MARRRNNGADIIRPIAGIIGFVVLVCFFNPAVRTSVIGLGVLAVWGVALLLGVGLGFAVFRSTKRKRPHDDVAKIEYYQHNSLAPTSSTPSRTHFVQPPAPTTPRPIVRVDCSPVETRTVTEDPDARFRPRPALTSAEIIEKLREIDWFQFEKLVALVYEGRGFKVERRGGANPDGGIDLIIELGGQRKAVQCKQWKTWSVGVKAVREFLGALTDARIQQGIFITLNGYTEDATQLAEKHGIEIITEDGLKAMIDDLNICNDPRVLEVLDDTTKYCPKCERLMVERVAGKGPNAGQRFWGCSGYPKCRFILRTSTQSTSSPEVREALMGRRWIDRFQRT
jgi:hypothetical protein